MILTETAKEMGINAPKDHQRAISKLNAGLAFLFYKEGKISLEPLPKTMIDEGQTSPVPDILLYNNREHTTPVIIEVSHPAGVRNDLKKVKRLIEEEDYGTVEGFIFDYINRTWKKNVKGKGEVAENPSWSDVLQIDLHGVMIP
jgi:Uma2 family endonuclease